MSKIVYKLIATVDDEEVFASEYPDTTLTSKPSDETA